MAFITNDPIPGIGSALFQPVLINDFSIHFSKFSNQFNENMHEVLTKQVVKCSVDYLNKELTIWLAQPVIAGVHEAILELVQSQIPTQISINFKFDRTLVFANCSCVMHTYNLDYSAKTDQSVHVIKFKFNTITEK